MIAPITFFQLARGRSLATLTRYIWAGLIGCLLAPQSLAAQGTGTRFAVTNSEAIQWGGVASIATSQPLANGEKPEKWVVSLNGVELKVSRVFVGDTANQKLPEGFSTAYSLVLLRPEYFTNPNDTGRDDQVAATIRQLAPEWWQDNVVKVALKFDGVALTPSEADHAGFRLASKTRLGVCVVIVILLAALLLWTWFRTPAFRDPPPTPPQPDPGWEKRPYSLNRFQLGFWTTLVVGGYLFLYLTTGQFVGLLNETAVFLLGISAGTTVLGAIQDSSTPPTPPAVAIVAPPPVHTTWLKDILSDSQGINLHRLQMVIWTLVFGFVFVSQLVTRFAFPTFDNSVYVLMGISSSTYVWFKKSET